MRRTPVLTAALVFGALMVASAPIIRAQQTAPPAPTGPMAPEKYKNIQVLTDVPADQLDVTMRYFSAALGWQCQNCHTPDRTTGVIDFAADTGNGKKTARSMINLVKTVNAGDFGAKITCGTCHAGHNQPLGLQPAAMMTPEQVTAAAAQAAAMAARQGGPGGAGPGGAPGQPGAAGGRPGGPPQGAPGGAPGGGRGPQTPAPPVDDVLNKFMDAIGGRAAIEKLQSRVMTGTLMSRDSKTVSFTIEQKGAKYRESVQTTPAAVTRAFDGTAGWMQTGDATKDIDGFLLQQALRGADLMLPLQLSKYANLTAGRPTRIALTPGATPIDVNLLSGNTAPNVQERLYFDATTGLLVRRTSTTRTPASINGTLSETYDYSDYRVVAGVKMPYTIKRTNWNALDTLTVTDIKVNTTIEDATFGRPKG
jgi:hypothetical protein